MEKEKSQHIVYITLLSLFLAISLTSFAYEIGKDFYHWINF